MQRKKTKPAKAAHKKNKNAKTSIPESSKPKRDASVPAYFGKAFFTSISQDDFGRLSDSERGRILSLHWKISQGRNSAQAQVSINNTSPARADLPPLTIINIVSDDMAFIIDSITSLLAERGLPIDMIYHPLLSFKRGAKREIEDVKSGNIKDWEKQSHLYIQLARYVSEDRFADLADDILQVIQDVRHATRDWQAMRAKVKECQRLIPNAKKALTEEDRQEYSEFLNYLYEDNFTLLGTRTYKRKTAKDEFKPVSNSGLGLLNDSAGGFLNGEEKDFLRHAGKSKTLEPVTVFKLHKKSTVHRRVPIDAVCVAHYDDSGNVIGLQLFIGLFTSVTYSRSIRGIPLLRHRASKIIRRAGFAENSHDSRALRHVLEKFPRDELFQYNLDQLYQTCLSILHLQDRPRVALFKREDILGQYMSCLVYIPRDRFDTRLRVKFQTVLEDALGGVCSNYYSTVDDSPLARVIYILQVKPTTRKETPIHVIEQRLRDIGRTWAELLDEAIYRKIRDEVVLGNLTMKYGQAFPLAYQEKYEARQAYHDIEKIERVLRTGQIGVDFFRHEQAEKNRLSLKLFTPGTPVPLSDILPVLENMGVDVIAEYPYEIKPANDKSVWIQDFVLEIQKPSESALDWKSIKADFEDLLISVHNGALENDSLNKLVISAPMPARDIAIVRTYIRYLRQTKMPYGLPYLEQALTDYPAIAKLQASLFHTLFNPKRSAKDDAAVPALLAAINQSLESVKLLDQDKILRAVTALIDCTLRTNFFQKDKDGQNKPYISIKLDSARVPEIQDPRPYREIFVYAPRIEGVHLRGDAIARGGLRWSDRHEDFRSEVLGLMKAQTVKNAVIVPTGAKGGFVVKKPPKGGDRAAYHAEGVECYRMFIRGLLDITDNMKGMTIIPPTDVVRRDADDPYLVVAADKGTATFSDIANSISLEYGFWMGDAFASGGSAGYDHKKMGITARGAWESVKRHFRELNHNTQTQPFDVIGVGDMGGDVFGNGMLQSKQIRLFAAFNHIHIFCDPDPDTAESYKERERLFNGVLGWDQYDTKKLSKGGRIYNRADKALTLTPEIQKRLDLNKSTVTPAELIHAILCSRTDLLFFGGIGTFIKATTETHADASDKSNDSLRVDAPKIRAKVVGEGANLGMTQRARIEYALHGGKLNTDFIDNSAGVDTSDHEVNIKILMTAVMAKKGSTMTRPKRDQLLRTMTDDVAQLVLRDNYQQTQALSQMELSAAETLSDHAALLTSLERDGLLRRNIEFLPDDDAIHIRQRQGKGLTRPELSLLLCYAKMTYTDALLKSDLPDQEGYESWLVQYFPEALQTKYKDEIFKHRLKRNIIATAISNAVINRMGPTFVRAAIEKTGASYTQVTEAYLYVRKAFGLRDMWDRIEALDNKVPAIVQLRANRDIARLAERATLWILRHGYPGGKGTVSAVDTRAKIQVLIKDLAKSLPASMKDHILQFESAWASDRMPADLSKHLAILPLLESAFDILQVCESIKRPVQDVAGYYFTIGNAFHLDWLRQHAAYLHSENDLTATAVENLIDQLYHDQAGLTGKLLSTKKKAIEDWIADDPKAQALITLVDRLRSKGSPDFAAITLAEQRLRNLF